MSDNPLIPERDDRISQRTANRSNNGARQKASSAPKPPPSSGGGLGKLMILLLLLAVAGIGGFAWQQSLVLSDLQSRFNELAAKIESTDESLSQSGAALSIKLKDQGEELEKHWTEIKKLWGVSYDTNRKAIASNKAIMDAQSAALKKNEQSLKTLQAKLDQAGQKFETLSSSALANAAAMEEIQDRLQTTLNKLASLEKSYQQLQSGLTSRIQENERAIESIDAYRRQVNQQLTQVRQQLGLP